MVFFNMFEYQVCEEYSLKIFIVVVVNFFFEVICIFILFGILNELCLYVFLGVMILEYLNSIIIKGKFICFEFY